MIKDVEEIFTDRIRSMGEGNVFKASICPQGGEGVCRVHPPGV